MSRLVAVTGAGGGIGRAIALAFAADGADVLLCGRSTDRLHAVAGEIDGRATVLALDVTDEDAVAKLADAGPVDVLCANSGVAGPTAPLWEITPAQWQETFAVNVFGAYLCARAVLPGMIARGGGSVVFTGSITGRRPLSGRTPYAASKTALIGLTRTLAAEAGPHGVRVNLVSPGPVGGPRVDAVIAAQAQARGLPEHEVRAGMLAGQPLGRFVTAEEVAAAVTYLAGPGASGITGQDLVVAAGGLMT